MNIYIWPLTNPFNNFKLILSLSLVIICMIVLDFFANLYLMTFDLVLSKPRVKQNCTAQEVDRHAPLIAYRSRVFH